MHLFLTNFSDDRMLLVVAPLTFIKKHLGLEEALQMQNLEGRKTPSLGLMLPAYASTWCKICQNNEEI